MSMGKVAIANTTRAVATNISLVGEVRGVRRVRWADEDGRSGEAQQLGEQQVAPQPSGEVVRLDHQRSRRGSGEEREEASVGCASTRVSRTFKKKFVDDFIFAFSPY